MKKDVVAHEDAFTGSKMKGLTTVSELVMSLEMAIPTHLRSKDIVFACIGTDRSTGDAVGPIVGTILKKKKYNVVGTLKYPLHAMNLTERLAMIEQGKFIIAVDSCLGNVSSIGTHAVIKGSLKPGAGVNKDLPSVGDVSVTSIVNVGGFMEHFVLQNTRLNLVMDMSQDVATALHQVMKNRDGIKARLRQLVLV
jgi:putative sporulation protein YyaC